MMKKTKNYIRIVAVLLAVVTMFTVPVSADDYDNVDYLNVLDYSGVDESNSNFFYFTNSGHFTWDLPADNLNLCYIDMVFYLSSGSPITSVVSDWAGYDDSLTLVHIGSNLYRAYGSISSRNYSSISLTFTSGGISYCEMLQLKVSRLKVSSFNETGHFQFSFNGGSWKTYEQSSYGSATRSDYFGSTASYQSFGSYFQCRNWKKYDYLDFQINVNVNSIASLYVYCGGLKVPFSVSIFESNAQSEYLEDSVSNFYYGEYTDEDGIISYYPLDGETDYTLIDPSNSCYLFIRIDLRGLDRTTTSFPSIYINGNGSLNIYNSISLVSVKGIVEAESVNPLYYYFSGLSNIVSSAFSSLQSSMESWSSLIYDLQNDQLEQQILTHNMVSSAFSSLQTALVDKLEKIRSDMEFLIYYLHDGLVNKLSLFQSSMESWFKTVRDLMVTQYNNMVTYLTGKFKAVTDRLDKLIGGTTEGDELSDGAADLEDQAGDIHDFEQSQQAVLDNNFDAIQGAVTFTGFTAALAFVQRYINFSWSGIQGFSVIYTLPIFIGLFFFVCGRIPGATRWRSRPPKDGGSA